MCIRDALVNAWCLPRRQAGMMEAGLYISVGLYVFHENDLHYLVCIHEYRLGRRYGRRVWRYSGPLALPTSLDTG